MSEICGKWVSDILYKNGCEWHIIYAGYNRFFLFHRKFQRNFLWNKRHCVPEMRTRTKMKNVASDRARRENVPRHILSYCYRKCTGATGLVLTNKVEGQSSRNKWDKFYFVQWRWNSKIVEASAEHDFRPKRFIGMVCTTEFETVLLCNSSSQPITLHPRGL